ncbi:hypothetical protein PROVRETT_06084 [Providencia rettgeri DSM 1131]|nr:hypothetical protein PROVRETT_06084 [Providencia rettgeri DSM 1131]
MCIHFHHLRDYDLVNYCYLMMLLKPILNRTSIKMKRRFKNIESPFLFLS